MDRLTFAFAWPRLLDDPLRVAKRSALTDHVAPLFEACRAEGLVDGWMHVFWGDDPLDTKVIRVTAWGADGSAIADRLRDHLTSDGLTAGVEFRIAREDEEPRRRRFWGELEETWLRATDALSSLAVGAVEGRLGEPLAWHVDQNRPGHLWANQLGLTYMDEAAVYQRLALGYFEHATNGTSTPSDERLPEIREAMGTALETLPAPAPEPAPADGEATDARE